MKIQRTIVCLTLLGAALPAPAEETLTLGVFPRLSAGETTTRYTPLAEHLSERLGRKVTLATSKDFQTFWFGIEKQRYEIVQYNQYHYVRSAKSYQVVAHNKEFGKDTLAGVLYVRKDSGITDLKQLKGRTVMFGGGEDAMFGYIAPMYLLLQAGLKKEEFSAQFASNPLNSVIGVFRKQADAAGSGDGVIGQPAVRNAINTDDITTLAISEQLLHLPWAVKRSMPMQLRKSIQSILVDLENTESGRQVLKDAMLTGIGKAEDKDYDPHRRMIRTVMGNITPL